MGGPGIEVDFAGRITTRVASSTRAPDKAIRPLKASGPPLVQGSRHCVQSEAENSTEDSLSLLTPNGSGNSGSDDEPPRDPEPERLPARWVIILGFATTATVLAVVGALVVEAGLVACITLAMAVFTGITTLLHKIMR